MTFINIFSHAKFVMFCLFPSIANDTYIIGLPSIVLIVYEHFPDWTSCNTTNFMGHDLTIIVVSNFLFISLYRIDTMSFIYLYCWNIDVVCII
jgi:hypothetical protein